MYVGVFLVFNSLLSDLADFNVFLGECSRAVPLAFLGWVLEAGNLECVAGWLASPCLHAMFSGGKNGGKQLRRFLGLCERVSLARDFACRFWMKSFFCKPLGLGLVLGW
jgi:hypothetical protein